MAVFSKGKLNSTPNTEYATDSYFIYLLKMEYVSKIILNLN